MKTCTKCKEEKDLAEFNRDKKKTDGLQSWCKCCKKAYYKIWGDNNRDSRKKYMAKWTSKNKEHIRQYNKENAQMRRDCFNRWRKDNLTHINNYKIKRRKENPHHRLIDNLRTGLKRALTGGSKSQPTLDYLGCSADDFKKHMVKQFTEGMTIDNYGVDGWVIDHIIPVSSFDHGDDEQVKICWHHSNMQPLWDIDNKIKSDKMPHEL